MDQVRLYTNRLFFYLEYELIFKYFSGTLTWAFLRKKTKQKFPEEICSEMEEWK